MLQDVVADAGGHTPEELHERYVAELQTIIDEVGSEAAVAAGADEAVVAALETDDDTDVPLADAAAILAAREEAIDADSIVMESRDDLLMGMSMAVLDVETLSSELNGVLEPKEIQAMIEGRFPMTLQQFALIKQAIDARRP